MPLCSAFSCRWRRYLAWRLTLPYFCRHQKTKACMNTFTVSSTGQVATSDMLKTSEKGGYVPDMECRVAKLEQRQESLEQAINELKDEHRRKMDKVFDVLEEMKKLQEKQRGFVGGVVWTCGAVFSFAAWFFSTKIGGA